MSEEKPIPGFPGYTITRSGTIRNAAGKKMSPRKDNDGYLRVDLRINGDRVTRFVHTLVEKAFGVGGAKEVDHKDGDRTNNNASNLETVSRKENMKRMGERQRKKNGK